MVKVSVMGSTGIIGKNVTFNIARADTVSEVILFSRPESIDKAKGQSYDMYDALAAEDIDCRLTPSCNYEDLAGSHIVLITAGAPRQEGMSRRDLAFENAKIVSKYAKQVAKYAPDAVILVATNPVDVMTTIALDASGFSRRKVIGVGNHLDSLRLKNYFARRLNINSSEVHTRVIGEHGDNMVPLLSSTTIGGIPLKYFIREVELDVKEIIRTLRNAGNTIISKKGATEYGPAYAISNLITTVITNTHKILTVSLYLDGEITDVNGVALGVPAVMYKKGIAMIVPIRMNDYETVKFQKAAEEIRKLTDEVRESLKSDN
ncbi:malate dehydrogenase [uncultured Methanobrevibacter sp.]|uniref:malate dehydrogenase n=1 Tax=uncultured Methanobrevibacter sp. TaxID=253161 RepID=UPI0025F59B66|nr:malate dehydrogenase [uncultured Methanobrevibacter sp.]